MRSAVRYRKVEWLRYEPLEPLIVAQYLYLLPYLPMGRSEGRISIDLELEIHLSARPSRLCYGNGPAVRLHSV